MSLADKPTPSDWPRLSASLFYQEPKAAIEWLCKAFGFEVRILVEHEGRVRHSELTLGGAVLMVGGEDPEHRKASWQKSPKSIGGANTGAIMLYIDDADAHCERARAAGGIIDMEPTTNDHGEGYWVDRSYGVIDPEGHYFWFCQRIK